MNEEQALTIACEGERLLGVVHLGRTDIGAVVVVGGPQYRAGSHRQFVRLARALAAAGVAVLRFDLRGMGDSTGAPRTFEHASADIAAAIDALQRAQPQVRRVLLWGLCDGASAALLYLHERPDARVVGVCLLNPWVRSSQSLARTHVKHYYRQRLLQAAFWRKLLTGGVAMSALAGLWHSMRAATGRGATRAAAHASYQTCMAHAWRGFAGPIWLLLSGSDYTAKEFVEYARDDPDWAGLLDQPRVRRLDLPGADHTLSARQAQAAMQSSLQAWIDAELGPAR